MKSTSIRPRFPQLLTFPLHLVPNRLHSALVATLLDRVFSEQRAEGELDFMDSKTADIRVLDAGIELGLTLGPGGFEPRAPTHQADLVIEGIAYDYMLLITGREDPDTLFFQRRLRIFGDTALGVHLKNFLASVDPDSLPLSRLVRPGLETGLRLYERILG